jgi:hypothetical protein
MLGLAPMLAQEGDHIFILRGAKVPFILRKTGEQGRFRVVGEAYLHGYMHGELEKLNFAIQEAVLV